MNKYDRLLANWAKQNAEKIYSHLETQINPDVDWRAQGIVELVFDIVGTPSEMDESEPYFEELQHVLNDESYDLGIPIPKEITALRFSLWAGRPIPLSHTLIANSERWRDVAIAADFDDAEKEDMVELVTLLHSVVSEEVAENLPTLDGIESHYQDQPVEGKLYTIGTEYGILRLVIGDEKVAAMNDDGKVVIMDFDGNRLGPGGDRTQNYIIQGAKFSSPLTDEGELASLVGNHTAAALLGSDGISVFDLPDE